ncbi:MAG: Clp protease N-terminal domain-containing protein [Chloroflexota bacterium]
MVEFPNMEQFTQRARRVMAMAQEVAARDHHIHVDIGHVLLALTLEDGGIGGRVLRQLGIDRVRAEMLYDLIQQNTLTMQDDDEHVPVLSTNAERLLELAIAEAEKIGNPVVDTEHVLMGLVTLYDPRMEEALYGVPLMPEALWRTTRHVLIGAPGRRSGLPTLDPDEERMVEFVLYHPGAAELKTSFQVSTLQLEMLLRFARAKTEDGHPLVVDVTQFEDGHVPGDDNKTSEAEDDDES